MNEQLGVNIRLLSEREEGGFWIRKEIASEHFVITGAGRVARGATIDEAVAEYVRTPMRVSP